MAENKRITKKIELPIQPEEIAKFRIGDIVYLTGTILTARDHAHKRIIELKDSNQQLPTDLLKMKNHAIYHCGPIIHLLKDSGDKKFQLFSAGPTTSARMTSFQKRVCEILNIKVIIGKGGMPDLDFSKFGGLYLSFTGGCGAIFKSFLKSVKGVIWDDLGMPEAVWILKVRNFGPLIVAQDSHGKRLVS
ncbi:MAG: fumarate hydratase [Candidatus Lokiarchaeota archaeon]|nr:fumarate hydratase [Candidatus Lokiarchaeota archaeon]